MAKAKAKAKKSGVKKKGKKTEIQASWMAVGFDVSFYTISAGAFAWDKTLNRLVGPAAVAVRWTKDIDYFKRLGDAARAYNMIHDLQADLRVIVDTDEIYIAVEEAVAFSHMKKGASGVEKQQLQISGSLMGGLVRWGYSKIAEIPANKWRKLVADELAHMTGEDLTIHGPKWNNYQLADQFHCHPKNVGKFRAKQWCLEKGYVFDWPDIIDHTKHGRIPRPEDSRAQGAQSDDRFEAIAMAMSEVTEIQKRA